MRAFLSSPRLSTVTGNGGSNALANLAATLTAGQSSTALSDSWPGQSSTFFDDIEWSNRFHYDHANNRAHMLGKGPSGQPLTNFLWDGATNSWTSASLSTGLGHVYECIAYNPTNGEVWSTKSGDNTLMRWTVGSGLSTWTDPATSGYGVPAAANATYPGYTGSTQVQPTICWFPNAYGSGDGAVLIVSGSADFNSRVTAWRRSTDSYTDYSGTSHFIGSSFQAQRSCVVYCRGGDYALAAFQASTGTPGRTYRLAAGSAGSLGSATQVADAPIVLHYPEDPAASPFPGMLFDDPTGGAAMYILAKDGTNRVWKTTDGGDSWTLKGYTHPFPFGVDSDEPSYVVASCYPLGVFWCKAGDVTSGTKGQSRVWKPND